MVYRVLAEELADRVHALRLSLGVPKEGEGS
jgi:stress-induced morphogen